MDSPNHPLAQQVTHNRLSAGDWELYAEHRARVTKLLLGILNATRTVDTRVCVLGAGNCNDLELGVLIRHCRELHLVDFDSEALHRGLTSQLLTTGREDVVDVPGGGRVTLQGGVDLTGAALDPGCVAQTKDARALVQHALAGPTLDLGGPYDVAVSTTLLTQLTFFAVEALGKNHPNLNAVILALRDGHLRLLARLLRPRGVALLVTDVVSSDTLPELLVVERPEALDGLLRSALTLGNFFTGANPYAVATALRRESILRKTVTDVSMVGPWRWRVEPRRAYLVVALYFRRF